jgi:hypothetical protein
MLTIALLVSLLIAIAILVLLFLRLRKLASEHLILSREHANLKDRVRDIVDVDAEKQRVLEELEIEKKRVHAELDTSRAQAQAEKQHVLREAEVEKKRILDELESSRAQIQADITRLNTEQNQALEHFQKLRQSDGLELQTLQANINQLRGELKVLDEEANLQSFGFYKPRYDFASSARYQNALDAIRERQKRMIKDKSAAICQIEWTVNGSRTEGRKQINQTLKLILRAFNGESDAAIAKVKYSNVGVMEARIRKAWDAINALAGVQQCQITRAYHDLKLEELFLAHEYQEKVYEEKEEQRRIREQMREEELALREIEKARLEAEREEKRYADALRKAQEEVNLAIGDKQQKLLTQIEELQRRLEEAHTNKERAISRAQMTRSGHVYIISNVGSFGEHVYKIGMTRRLDPLDRVRELSDASVPFQFDVHAIIYSEDAPTLENALHRIFNNRRVNRVNMRKEFFQVSIDEIAKAVREHHGEIEVTQMAEAIEYRKTLSLLQESQGIFEDKPLSISEPSFAQA